MSNHTIYLQTYKSLVGEMILGSYGNALCIANWKYGKTTSYLAPAKSIDIEKKL